MKEKLVIVAFALLATVGMACGGSPATPTPAPTPTSIPTTTNTPPSSTPTPPKPNEICREPTLGISVNGDAFEFDIDRFEVAAGSDVVSCFNNVSTVSPHNWVLVKDGTKDEVAERGLMAGAENDYVQPGDPDVIAFMKLVGSGGTGETSFVSPLAGTYQFVCTVPGHNFIMFGEFVVTP